MKIIEVTERVDELYPNSYKMSEKLAWCDELGEMLMSEYKKSYIGADTGKSEKYIPISDPITDETVVKPPYDAMYIDYLIAKCCYYQRDYDAYNQHILLFNNTLSDYAKWYIERNMPERDTKNRVNNWW